MIGGLDDKIVCSSVNEKQQEDAYLSEQWSERVKKKAEKKSARYTLSHVLASVLPFFLLIFFRIFISFGYFLLCNLFSWPAEKGQKD